MRSTGLCGGKAQQRKHEELSVRCGAAACWCGGLHVGDRRDGAAFAAPARDFTDGLPQAQLGVENDAVDAIHANNFREQCKRGEMGRCRCNGARRWRASLNARLYQFFTKRESSPCAKPCLSPKKGIWGTLFIFLIVAWSFVVWIQRVNAWCQSVCSWVRSAAVAKAAAKSSVLLYFL